MKREIEHSLRSFLAELVVYAVLVTGYYFLVLHLLGSWLHHLFAAERPYYAALSLALIVFQGLGLEFLTRTLVRWAQDRLGSS
jgi:hypothetical protein